MNRSISHADPAQRIQAPQCTLEELAASVGLSPENDRLIAAHHNSGAEILKKLSYSADSKTREIVASNPNAPLDVLMSLADEFPRAFVLNPAFELMFLEEPGILERLYTDTLAKIVAQRECPQQIIDWAYNSHKKARSFNSRVLRGIARNPNTSLKTINAIIRLHANRDTQDVEITCEEGFL